MQGAVTATVEVDLATPDFATALGLGQHGADLFGRSHVVGELDPGCAVTAERCPEAEDHSSGLEEADLVIGLVTPRPAERLVELAGAGKILHAERHQADALFHGHSIAAHPEVTPGVTACWAPSQRCAAAEPAGALADPLPATELAQILGRRQSDRGHGLSGRLRVAQRPGCVEQLAGLEQCLQAREDHRPAAVELRAGVVD
jgi:hypothetical protein